MRKALSLPEWPAESIEPDNPWKYLPGYLNHRASSASIFPVSLPRSSSVESIPEFRIPDYTAPSEQMLRCQAFSPLTLPGMKRASTTGSSPMQRISIDSVCSDSSDLMTTSTVVRRRSSSMTTLHVKKRTTLDPLAVAAASPIGVAYMTLLFTAPTSKTNHSDVLKRNPPTLPKHTPRLTRALTTLFASRQKGIGAIKPYPVDTTTLVSVTGIPLVVPDLPRSLPLVKGPAPEVRPVRKFDGLRRQMSNRSGNRRAEMQKKGVVCPGW
ncbi:hypothetical protein FB45DRAFT_1044010 [Roridomyces roridus]|uniref:Uncharacterized protein n=1 Tax=Roridomyces roridus TaxID=1738132 RepID=A0AAD7AYE8_9AGAR|nr:hypothetical protein FB45DRAFT_1044010 [Roridomyces roridus]